MKSGNHTLRVLLADDHALVRAGIRALLERLSGVTVVGEAGDGQEVLERVKSCRPDVIVMDIGMPRINGIEATARLSRDYPAGRVVIVSVREDEDHVWQALKAGAVGFVLKRSAAVELEKALQRAMQGQIYLCRQISRMLLEHHPPGKATAAAVALDQLTVRQREILQLIAEGQNTKQIAQHLRVSPKTVEYHRLRVMDRLGIHNIPGLVRFALRKGLVSQEV